MLFSSHKAPRLYGYFDDWGADGYYHYTGEGTVGDQRMTGGNLNILKHREDGRPLHVFRPVSSGVVQHFGEFALAEENPWYRMDRPDRDGEMRSVITFRLRPVSLSSTHAPPTRPHRTETTIEDVDIEQRKTERSTVGAQPPREAERRESLLVQRYRAHLQRRGLKVTRKKIALANERTTLHTDLYIPERNFLVEAKGTVTRDAIRTGIGQLFDYQRYIAPHPTLGILLPSRPRQDMLDLCAALSITSIWAEEDSFIRTVALTSGELGEEEDAGTS
ncbi:restriction endonuclease [Streptomyces sp. E11-3]|uniref:restriction endonuclease n=1 Tax=Streptomyces sp. E11-3 TaxID=3110112 RepID=UPI00397EB4C2